MTARIIWTFKNNEMAPASSRSTACVAPAARPVVLPQHGRAAPIAAVPNCHRTVRVPDARQDRAAATLSLRPRAYGHSARGTLARSQLGSAAPLFDATADQWIVPPSSVTEDAGAAAELRPTHYAAPKRPTAVSNPQAVGRVGLLEFVTVAMGMAVFGMTAFVLLVIA